MRLTLSTQAELDLLEAANYLEAQRPGLALEFEEALAKAFDSLRLNWKYAIKYENIRTYKVRPFAYVVHYRCLNEEIRIEALIHGKSIRRV